VLASRDGKIVCENTLDARLQVVFRKKLPEVSNTSLFFPISFGLLISEVILFSLPLWSDDNLSLAHVQIRQSLFGQVAV